MFLKSCFRFAHVSKLAVPSYNIIIAFDQFNEIHKPAAIIQ